MVFEKLKAEKLAKMPGGLYHKTQIKMAYNSNRIEGSKLSEEQTIYIFQTNTIGFADNDAIPVDDIIETINHFDTFDIMLDSMDKELSNDLIKDIHKTLKMSTRQSKTDWFAIGDWKKIPNEVGFQETAPPKKVQAEMDKLNNWYLSLSNVSFENIIEYHYRFEKIHPFQDGNGRVGRLIMFRECLKNNVMPFIIEEIYKMYYYRGLREFAKIQGYLLDTCRAAQDTYTKWVEYFYPELTTEETK